ncbi:MAG TPA: asparagine synthetase B, partial [Candidatus Omnitrophica bacterium]|nr:asparagine synthetase B [Candidatus Omnitrophota bacterium]
GGDELFAGYERYQAMLGSEAYHKMPAVIRNAISSFAGMLPDSINPKNQMRKVKRLFNAINLPKGERYLRWIGMLNEPLKRELYSDDFLRSVSAESPLEFINPFLNNDNNLLLTDALLYTDTMTYLPNDLLVKVDIASMANSLEARSPFLDHKLMEFTARLPANYKLRMFSKKHILKKAVKGFIPRQILNRKKMGFGVPVGRWFRNELKGLLKDTLLSDKSLSRGYFKPDGVKLMVKQHVDQQKDYTFSLWTLLMLELWHNRFID